MRASPTYPHLPCRESGKQDTDADISVNGPCGGQAAPFLPPAPPHLPSRNQVNFPSSLGRYSLTAPQPLPCHLSGGSAGPGLSIISSHVLRTLDLLRATFTETQARDRLSAQPDRPTPPALRGSRSADRGSIAALVGEGPRREPRDRAGGAAARRSRHARLRGSLCGEHREHDRQREGAGRRDRPAAHQRAERQRRFPRSARHHRSRAGRILCARRGDRVARRRRQRRHADGRRAAQPRVQIRAA